jgi:hypothetical protein
MTKPGEQSPSKGPGRRSTTADTAAARWGLKHPESDLEHPPPSRVPEDEQIVPNRHSASAEAAALRWREEHEQQEEEEEEEEEKED